MDWSLQVHLTVASIFDTRGEAETARRRGGGLSRTDGTNDRVEELGYGFTARFSPSRPARCSRARRDLAGSHTRLGALRRHFRVHAADRKTRTAIRRATRHR